MCGRSVLVARGLLEGHRGGRMVIGMGARLALGGERVVDSLHEAGGTCRCSPLWMRVYTIRGAECGRRLVS